MEGGRSRLRAILMTAAAMIAGMIPMALGFGEGAEQTAPLGRAVIGGLVAATVATLAVLPSVYAILQRRAGPATPSLDPDDPASRFYGSLGDGGWEIGLSGHCCSRQRGSCAADRDVTPVVSKT